MNGRKDDKGKARWHLVPWEAMGPVVEVLMHGAEKYGANNWTGVDDWDERYSDAAMRHLTDDMQGYVIDNDSGLPAIAHAVCSLLFLLSKRIEEREVYATPEHHPVDCCDVDSAKRPHTEYQDAAWDSVQRKWKPIFHGNPEVPPTT